MAQNYLLTYEEIERQIFSGSLVHAMKQDVDVRGFNNSYVLGICEFGYGYLYV
jgi:hypothetical protein